MHVTQTQPWPLPVSCYLSVPSLSLAYVCKTFPAQDSNGFQHLCSNTGSHLVSLDESNPHQGSDPRSVKARGQGPLRPHWRRTYLSSTLKHLIFLMYPSLSLEKAMAPHSSTPAWKIPWTEEPDGLQSVVSQRIRQDLVNGHVCTQYAII